MINGKSADEAFIPDSPIRALIAGVGNEVEIKRRRCWLSMWWGLASFYGTAQ
jgi:hypothetical protein